MRENLKKSSWSSLFILDKTTTLHTPQKSLFLIISFNTEFKEKKSSTSSKAEVWQHLNCVSCRSLFSIRHFKQTVFDSLPLNKTSLRQCSGVLIYYDPNWFIFHDLFIRKLFSFNKHLKQIYKRIPFKARANGKFKFHPPRTTSSSISEIHFRIFLLSIQRQLTVPHTWDNHETRKNTSLLTKCWQKMF